MVLERGKGLRDGEDDVGPVADVVECHRRDEDDDDCVGC